MGSSDEKIQDRKNIIESHMILKCFNSNKNDKIKVNESLESSCSMIV